jgi:cell wall-associated NlpC family hydrolase
LGSRFVTLSPIATIISSLIIAVVGSYFTYSYNQRQLEMQRAQNDQNDLQNQRNANLKELEVVDRVFPHLADEKTREGAIGIISALARPATAASVAAAFPSPESARALATLAASSGGMDRQELTAGLVTVVTTSKPAAQVAAPILQDAKAQAVKIALDLKSRTPALKFQWGGKTPEDGFDSSGFVAYVLNEAGLLRNYKQYNSTALQQRLGIDRAANVDLHAGDLIFYSEGTCMLYVGNSRMLGMLEEGIIDRATSDDIGHSRLGVGHVGEYRASY